MPGSPVPTPASFDEAGVETLTPEAYASFRQTGIESPVCMTAFDRRLGFYQVGCQDDALPVEIESFELSSLHKAGPEAAFGLRVQPDGPQRGWLTHEFISPAGPIMACAWTEWILKVSTEEACEISVQFVVSGRKFNEKVQHSRQQLTEFASFLHIRVPGDVLRGMAGDKVVEEVRLLLGTGGKTVPLRIYGFSIFGKR